MIFSYPHNQRRPQRKQGFTIVEIVVVLAIIVIMIGASFAYLSGLGPEKEFKEATVELESMAREAQARAIMTHTMQRIVFTNKSFLMMENDVQPDTPEEWVTLPIRKRYDVPSQEMEVSIYRWGSIIPTIPSEKSPIVWIFPPDGFVEPITVKLTQDESYIKQTYHPLTASVVEEEMEIR